MYATIPEALKAKVKGDQAWERLMMDVFGNVGRHIVNDRPVFFPEYTDHGPRHVGQVIEVAWRLIAPVSHQDGGISAADASALAICALLHDIAMHVTEEGFKSLVTQGCRWQPLPGWGEAPWCDLWSQYLAEAKRWDDRKRKDVFGDEPFDVREPPLAKNGMTKGDHLLVGEFLRRHHPRLAHEIAIHGFPEKDGGSTSLLPRDARADLLGLMARSHGLPLRAAVDRLKRRRRVFQEVHSTYVMALLRIADYTDLQSDRAPAKALTLVRLLSPVSRAEWAAHGAIDEVLLGVDDDPEVLSIYASPPDVAVYAKVRSWLDGIQSELDQCWAVLGETYGRYSSRGRMDLSIRRVKSNLDDDDFAEGVTYLPEQIAFTTAGGSLLKLMVGPLYGEDPKYGIRELMQNAVDAVRERQELCRQRPDLEALPTDDDADVLISIDVDGEGKPVSVTFRDRGIGMTAEVIRDFFLKAGASFRNSPEWQKRFTDGEGKACLPRTGRFGIGALAAFLIGDTIDVATRHAESRQGLHFTTTLDEVIINVGRVAEAIPVGTTIVVRDLRNRDHLARWLKEEKHQDMNWDFFCQDWPHVVRKAGNRVLSQGSRVPDGPAWWPLTAPNLGPVHACWHPRGLEGLLVCNGILVDRHNYLDCAGGSIRGLDSPCLAIIDANGHLPLTLQRTGLAAPLPFEAEVRQLALLDQLARLLAWRPTSDRDGNAAWTGLASGITLTDGPLLRRCGVTVVLARYSAGTSGCYSAPAISQAIPEGAAILNGPRDFDDEDGGHIGHVFGAEAIRLRANWPFSRLDPGRSDGCLRWDESSGTSIYVEEAEFGHDRIFPLDQQIASQPAGTTLAEIFLDHGEDLDSTVADLWESITRTKVLSWDADAREAQLRHLMEDEEFARKVDFYRSVAEPERDPPVNFGWYQ